MGDIVARLPHNSLWGAWFEEKVNKNEWCVPATEDLSSMYEVITVFDRFVLSLLFLSSCIHKECSPVGMEIASCHSSHLSCLQYQSRSGQFQYARPSISLTDDSQA